MTVHAHCEERIRLLREALAWYSRCHLLDPIDRAVATDALETDEALATTPPPDLPLAEGSRRERGRDTARRELAALEWLTRQGHIVGRGAEGFPVALRRQPDDAVYTGATWSAVATSLGWDGTVPDA